MDFQTFITNKNVHISAIVIGAALILILLLLASALLIKCVIALKHKHNTTKTVSFPPGKKTDIVPKDHDPHVEMTASDVAHIQPCTHPTQIPKVPPAPRHTPETETGQNQLPKKKKKDVAEAERIPYATHVLPLEQEQGSENHIHDPKPQTPHEGTHAHHTMGRRPLPPTPHEGTHAHHTMGRRPLPPTPHGGTHAHHTMGRRPLPPTPAPPPKPPRITNTKISQPPMPAPPPSKVPQKEGTGKPEAQPHNPVRHSTNLDLDGDKIREMKVTIISQFEHNSCSSINITLKCNRTMHIRFKLNIDSMPQDSQLCILCSNEKNTVPKIELPEFHSLLTSQSQSHDTAPVDMLYEIFESICTISQSADPKDHTPARRPPYTLTLDHTQDSTPRSYTMSCGSGIQMLRVQEFIDDSTKAKSCTITTPETNYTTQT